MGLIQGVYTPFFQLTTSRRGRPRKTILTPSLLIFQLTTSRRGRHQKDIGWSAWVDFQLTTSRRGRRSCVVSANPVISFQLTTSRRGRRRWMEAVKITGKLSTHDLTKRSTRVCYLAIQHLVFQLTTSRRGRRSLYGNYRRFRIFQLTTSRRGRREPVRRLIPIPDLSTHDLTKRSTLRERDTVGCICSFNSRPHEEVDAMKGLIDTGYTDFQLTTSRRGRPVFTSLFHPHAVLSTHDLTKRSTRSSQIFCLVLLPINSRPHEEVDWEESDSGYEKTVFQLTTSRRGRRAEQQTGIDGGSFNSRPHEEVDGKYRAGGQTWTAFNSRPHEEVDDGRRGILEIKTTFQLTTSRRGRLRWIITMDGR